MGLARGLLFVGMDDVAILLGPEFEDAEYVVPVDRLRAGGNRVVIVGTDAGVMLRGRRGRANVTVDLAARDADPLRFGLLLIPGGHSPDNLRTDEGVVRFVQRFWQTKRPLAAMGHGAQLLIEADVVRGVRLTSSPSVRRDLENAGARWLEGPVVEDGALVTLRRSHELEALCDLVFGRFAARAA